MTPTEADVRRALDTVIDPCSVGTGVPLGLVEMGLVTGIEIDDGGAVQIRLRLTGPGCTIGIVTFEREIRARLGPMSGVTSVSVEFDEPIGWSEADMSERGARRLNKARRERRSRLGARVGTETPP